MVNALLLHTYAPYTAMVIDFNCVSNLKFKESCSLYIQIYIFCVVLFLHSPIKYEYF